jgi:hypothetical protein
MEPLLSLEVSNDPTSPWYYTASPYLSGPAFVL